MMDGWTRACDEALICNCLGVANADDSFEIAQGKLRQLIEFEIAVATDPKVNGGYVLVPEAFMDKFKASTRATNPIAVMTLVDEANDLLAAETTN